MIKRKDKYAKTSDINDYKTAILAAKSILHSSKKYNQDFMPLLLEKLKKSNKKSEAYRQAIYDSLGELADNKVSLPSKKRLELAVNLA
ncbi:hypothetical protein KDE13_09240 [Campylobacter sp. faydin G-140]|uniref:hypothetical protein n=1 Tax=Campylobacter anatolicus TaxID=2829105 RepID=UPI001B90EAB1|nr:hypothetical protein [Campylobacter anatolicus]MBR8466517.1 hypothetical protein [Campylobacter anatolicus]